MPPRKCGTEPQDHHQSSDPRARIRRPPERFRDGSNPIREPDGTAQAPKPTVKQTHRHQPVHPDQDAEYINIENHSDVDEDNDKEIEESVEQPIPRARAPRGQALPSPMGTVNSIDPLDSAGKGCRAAWDVHHFFDKTPDVSICRSCT